MRMWWLVSLLFMLSATVAMASPVEHPLADTAQETQAKRIFSQIRCVVCQGESIIDSQADVASAMRTEIRNMLSKGADEERILASFAERYGDAILMQPPVNRNTAFLWFAPLLLLLTAAVIAANYLRKQKHARPV